MSLDSALRIGRAGRAQRLKSTLPATRTDVQMSRLRRKIEVDAKAPQLLLTERGAGRSFEHLQGRADEVAVARRRVEREGTLRFGRSINAYRAAKLPTHRTSSRGQRYCRFKIGV